MIKISNMVYLIFFCLCDLLIGIETIEDFSRFDNPKVVRSSGRKIDQWMIKTNFHPVNKTGYEIITDHTDKIYINVLSKLANFHGGIVRCVNDFKNFKTKACFVAIAPPKIDRTNRLKFLEITL